MENQKGKKGSTKMLIFWVFGWKEKIDSGSEWSVSLDWNWKAFYTYLILRPLKKLGFFLLLLLNAMPIFNCKVPFQNLSKSFILKMTERFWKMSTLIRSLAKNIHDTLLSLVISFSPTLTPAFGTFTMIIINNNNNNIITQLCLEGLGTSPRSAMTNLFNSLGFCFTSHSLALLSS